MHFQSDMTEARFQNDPAGFQMPFELYGEFGEEVLKWKYFRLHNQPRFLGHVTLIGAEYCTEPDPSQITEW